MTEWYAPHKIDFFWHSIDWLFDNLPTLYEGHWPPDPTSSYTDIDIQRSFSEHAPFETPLQYALEVEMRCAACGTDGTMTIVYYRYGVSYEDLARLRHLTVRTVKRYINRVKKYAASGKCRRWVSCQTCVAKCSPARREKRKVETYKDWIL